MSEMASANITAYVTVGECGAMLIMYIYVTVAMGRILWRMFKRRKDVASNFTPTLIFHIFMWFVAAITGIVCNAYTVLAFNLDKPYPIMLFFWTNIPNFSTIFAAITAGIFLVIDRICMVTIKPARYIHVKTPLLILDVAFVVGTLIAGMAFYLISGAKEENDYCWNMACAINQFGVSFTILYRYILEVVYTLLDFVNVGECGAMLIMYIYVTLSAGWILWRMFKRRKYVASNFTPTLIFHIFMWFVAAITGIVCNAYMVLAFRPDKAYPIMPYFWTNIPNFTAIFAAVTAGIFLVIDRICMVALKPGRYDRIKNRLLFLDVAFVIGTLIAGISFYNIIGAKAGNNYCYNVGCAINPYGVTFTILYRSFIYPFTIT
uniref:G_PROTEIN_RECEP_F1_2 domain-containing protein n=1 Tax=Panagrellus redivivus TaxID=6233 RepID=A0A7E4UMP5_PANRE